MNHPTDWSRLRELAQDRRDSVGQRLAEAATLRDAARQKLEMLVDYRREYDTRLSQSALGGIGAEKLRSYRQFLANLERAIDQQTEALGLAQERVADAQQVWRGEQRRVDQKLTDEFSSRLALTPGAGDD